MKEDKHMGCVFCHREEMHNVKGIKSVFHYGKQMTSFVCSVCVQKLLRMPQSTLIEAYHSAIEKGYSDKALHIESLIDEEMEELTHDSKTRETRPDMVRERAVRKVRSSRHQIRV